MEVNLNKSTQTNVIFFYQSDREVLWLEGEW